MLESLWNVFEFFSQKSDNPIWEASFVREMVDIDKIDMHKLEGHEILTREWHRDNIFLPSPPTP